MNQTLNSQFLYMQYIIHAYHILLVNSHGYYKFQVEIGAAANQNLYRNRVQGINSILYHVATTMGGNYPSHGY